MHIHASASGANRLVSGATLVSKITPMKRILCLCPVQHIPRQTPKSDGSVEGRYAKFFEEHYDRYDVGAAVSDPYLTYASTVDLGRASTPPSAESEAKGDKAGGGSVAGSSSGRTSYPSWSVGLYVPKDHGRLGVAGTGGSRLPVFWDGLPSNRDDFLRDVGHWDVGALAVALPMNASRPPPLSAQPGGKVDQTTVAASGRDLVRLNAVRRSAQRILQNFVGGAGGEKRARSTRGRFDAGQERGPLDLQALIHDHLTLEDAVRLAEDEPEMWEGVTLVPPVPQSSSNGEVQRDASILLSVSDQERAVPASVHAAVALNAFLRRHTGGWWHSGGC